MFKTITTTTAPRAWFVVLVLLLLATLSMSQKQKQADSGVGAGDSPAAVARAKRTYQTLQSCLRFDREYNLQYPKDAEAHYKELLQRTSIYRGHKPHKGGNFQGPWIENYFIDHFLGKPLSYFGGFFPLFVQWSDYQLARKHNSTDSSMFEPLRSFLRPNVLYLAISQSNLGLLFLMTSEPNVVIMNAGGDGNIPIPLIKGELKFLRVQEDFPRYDVGFYGSPDHGPRKLLLDELQGHIKETKLRLKMGPSPQWIQDMSYTAFNLAPRGFGRASFRLAEIIQIGRIPVYLYDDHPWLPYDGSPIGPKAIGFLAKGGNLGKLAQTLTRVTNATIHDLLDRVEKARYFYTYEGVMEQIELFLRDPLGPAGGYLRCQKIPHNLEHQSIVLRN